MNTQKQILVMIVMLAIFTGGCAAYAAIDLPIRAGRQSDYFKSESVERGALLFANNCRTCHGVRGQGGTGLPLNTEAFKSQDPLKLTQNRELITRTLTCGRAGTLMPAWLVENGGSLTAIQIQHIVDLITSPIEEGLVDDTGNPTSEGWLHAAEFSHNLNSSGLAIIGGSTLDGIASVHGIGPAELAAENGMTLDSTLEKGDILVLPISGAKYKVKDGDTFKKISTSQHVGAMLIAVLNGISFSIDVQTGTVKLTYNGDDERFMIDPENGDRSTGLMPGKELKLPADATYTVVDGDTLDAIAEAHGTTADAIRAENSLAADTEPPVGFVLRLSAITAYPVVVQSLGDAAGAFSAVTARSLAAANGLDAEDELPVGKVLKMPGDAAGSAPPDSINDGTACVQYTVGAGTFTGIYEEPFKPEKPDALTTTLTIVAHANDWTFVNDGVDQVINQGVALIAPGTTVAFENPEGLHTINVNTEVVVELLNTGDTHSITFDEPGEFVIECTFHPDMFGVVYVGDAN